jgi:signal transduction histidine kinase
MLVQIEARLLAQKRSNGREILELQAGQRLFEAVLPAGDTKLPALTPGSLMALTGVCVIEPVSPPARGKTVWENTTAGSVRLLLRQSSDVVLLRGPPWWNWKRAAVLITLLFGSLLIVILRSYFITRQFERQQAARLAFARQLLQNQENERRRIAANLHDSLGQNLLAIKNQAHLALQSDAGNPALHRRLEDISGTALQALEEVRQITHDLRPYQLDRLGLTQSLRALIRRVSEDCSIVFASHVDEIDGIFENESEINIYRIVQESLNNVIKHSQATEAAIVLRRENGALTISIRDNGLGLSGSRGANETPAGFGLDGIRERISIMGGKMEMETSSGHGFILKVEIPLPTHSPCQPK